MAKARAVARVQALFGLIGVIALVVTYSLITGWNPLPSWGDWLRNAAVRTLSNPATTWTVRAGDEPTAATVLSQAIIVTAKGSVEARDPATGTRLWSHDSSWAAVAGGTRPVVLVGRAVGTGFDVYDAVSDVRLWGADDKNGVWAYSNMVLTLHCAAEFSCTMRALGPADGKPAWSLPITGAGRSLIGMGHAFAAVGPITSAYEDSFEAMPHPAPPIIGLPMGGEIHVISTVTGHALHVYRPDSATRVAVARHEVIVATSTLRGNSCYYTAQGRDPTTDHVLWSHEGYNLRTSSGLGCDQRHDPVGGGDAVLAIDTAGRDIMLDARTGNVLFRAPAGQHVVATDGRIAMVRTSDKRSLRAINLAGGTPLWTRDADRSALVGVAPGAVLITDPATGRLAMLGRESGHPLLDVATGATVLGIGGGSVVIHIGRSLGPLPVATAP